MSRVSGPPPQRSARCVHDALTRALNALTGAHRSAVLCFCEIAARRLYRELGYSSIHHYATGALGFSASRTAQFLRLSDGLLHLPLLREAVEQQRIEWSKALIVAAIATPQSEALWLAEAQRLSRPDLSRRARAARAIAREQRAAQVLAESTRPVRLPTCPDSPIPPPDLLAKPRVAPERATDGGWPGGSAAGLAAAVRPGAGAERTYDAGPAVAAATAVTPPRALLPSETAIRRAAAHLPVQITLRFTPSQYARFAAQCERLRKLAARGAASLPRYSGREELLLVALDDLISRVAAPHLAQGDSRGSAPGGAPATFESPPRQIGGASPYLIVIHQCEKCKEASVPAPDGPRPLAAPVHAAVLCDGRVVRQDGALTAGTPAAVRRAVMARDGWRCQAPGCGRTRFLEVHHRLPRAAGGTNDPDNLVTLCSACHQLRHERGPVGSGVGLSENRHFA